MNNSAAFNPARFTDIIKEEDYRVWTSGVARQSMTKPRNINDRLRSRRTGSRRLGARRAYSGRLRLGRAARGEGLLGCCDAKQCRRSRRVSRRLRLGCGGGWLSLSRCGRRPRLGLGRSRCGADRRGLCLRRFGLHFDFWRFDFWRLDFWYVCFRCCDGRRRGLGRRRFRLSNAQRFSVVGTGAAVRVVDADPRLALLAFNGDNAPLDLALVDVIRDGEGLAASRARDGKRHPKIRVHGSARCAPNLRDPRLSSSKRGANFQRLASCGIFREGHFG